MLLDIIILVLRETIEAAFLLGVLLSISNQTKIGYGWLWIGIVIGTISAVFYATNFSVVGEWFDYTGQEVINASIQFVIYFCLLWLCALLIFSKLTNPRLLCSILCIIIALEITREFAEMVIFYTGFFQSKGNVATALTSGFIGLMIGASSGALCYYAINSLGTSGRKKIQIGLLCLIAAGLSVQAMQLLIQIDWVSASKPLWNSNWLLDESSTFGQITYALFGYEATPTKPEAGLYIATLSIVLGLSVIKYFSSTTLRNN